MDRGIPAVFRMLALFVHRRDQESPVYLAGLLTGHVNVVTAGDIALYLPVELSRIGVVSYW